MRAAIADGVEIEHPRTAPICSNHQLTLARLDREIHHRGRRQQSAERFPSRTAVARHVHAKVGSHIENRRVGGILLDHIHRFLWQIPGNRAPRTSSVGRRVHIRTCVVLAEPGKARVNRPCVLRGKCHAAHPLSGEATVDRAPVRPVVRRQPEMSPFGAAGQHTAHERGLGEHRKRTGRHGRAIAAGGIADVGAHDSPVVATIGGLEHLISRGVQRARIMRRDKERCVPAEAHRRRATRRTRADVHRRRSTGEHRAAGNIHAHHRAVLMLVIDDPVVGGIDQRHVAVAARPPIEVDALPLIRDRVVERIRAWPVHRRVILRASEDPIRRVVVRRHKVHLRDGNVVEMQPTLARIVRHEQSAVVAEQEAVGVRRIDDQFVVIEMQRAPWGVLHAEDFIAQSPPGGTAVE